jgi:hypothetical protein
MESQQITNELITSFINTEKEWTNNPYVKLTSEQQNNQLTVNKAMETFLLKQSFLGEDIKKLAQAARSLKPLQHTTSVALSAWEKGKMTDPACKLEDKILETQASSIQSIHDEINEQMGGQYPEELDYILEEFSAEFDGESRALRETLSNRAYFESFINTFAAKQIANTELTKALEHTISLEFDTEGSVALDNKLWQEQLAKDFFDMASAGADKPFDDNNVFYNLLDKKLQDLELPSQLESFSINSTEEFITSLRKTTQADRAAITSALKSLLDNNDDLQTAYKKDLKVRGLLQNATEVVIDSHSFWVDTDKAVKWVKKQQVTTEETFKNYVPKIPSQLQRLQVYSELQINKLQNSPAKQIAQTEYLFLHTLNKYLADNDLKNNPQKRQVVKDLVKRHVHEAKLKKLAIIITSFSLTNKSLGCYTPPNTSSDEFEAIRSGVEQQLQKEWALESSVYTDEANTQQQEDRNQNTIESFATLFDEPLKDYITTQVDISNDIRTKLSETIQNGLLIGNTAPEEIFQRQQMLEEERIALRRDGKLSLPESGNTQTTTLAYLLSSTLKAGNTSALARDLIHNRQNDAQKILDKHLLLQNSTNYASRPANPANNKVAGHLVTSRSQTTKPNRGTMINSSPQATSTKLKQADPTKSLRRSKSASALHEV